MDDRRHRAASRALRANADLARRDLSRIIDSLPSVGASADEEVAEALADVYPALARSYGEAAAAVAVEYYAAERAAAGVAGEFEPTMAEAPDDDVLAGDVRAAARDAASGGGLAPRIEGALVRRVMGMSDDTLVLNARADPAHPKWAFVPGPGACKWCHMLGSRGFVYRTRDSGLAERHDNCACSVAVGFGDDPSLDGYDPKRHEDLWANWDERKDDPDVALWRERRNARRRELYAERKASGETLASERLHAIDVRDDLDDELKRMLKLATADSLGGASQEDSRKLAEAMQACLNSAGKAKSIEEYEGSTGRTLSLIGEVYGIDLRGEYLHGHGLSSAYPSGEEVWAVTHAPMRCQKVLFLGTDSLRGGSPDVSIDGVVYDIKTPRGLGKLGKRLYHAAEQCRMVGAEGRAILSSLYFQGDFGKALLVADEFVVSGTLREVVSVMPGSTTLVQ